jgi:hypothetical protein
LKKSLALLLMTFLILTSTALAAKKPVRIARLPIIIQQNKLDYETSAELELKFARVVNIPLNETLQLAEYIPPKESSIRLNEIWQKMYAQNENPKISDAVKNLAKYLKADIVICPILHQYYQRVIPSNLDFESLLSSAVSAELIIYDRRTGNLTAKKVSRRFNESYSRYGTASYLAGVCFDQLIKDTELRKTIHNIRS